MSTDKSQMPFKHKALVKSSSIVACGVLASRALGFIRDVILARFLGTGFWAEAFFVAQRIPNLFRDLVGEGAANAAIIPVLSEYAHQKSKKEWQECIHVVMAWGVIILGGITVIGICAAPWIVRVLTPGWSHHPSQVQLTVDLTRIMFPYLILIALTAFQAGILYSLNAFFTPAFGPCLLNVAMIASAWIACFFSWPLAYSIAVGVVIGGILQFALQLFALRRRGVELRLPLSLNHAGAKKIGKLLLPRLWGGAVYQINVFVDTFCASLVAIVGTGGIAAIYYANRMIQLPLGVFGYALASVSLPALSKLAQQRDKAHFQATLFFAVRNLMMILIPIAIAMFLGAELIIHSAFEHGAFNAHSTQITADVMRYAALGLPFFGVSRIWVSALYALQDTRTPVRTATICLGVNLVLNGVLMFPLKIGGIALASSLASMVNCFLLYRGLAKKLHGF